MLIFCWILLLVEFDRLMFLYLTSLILQPIFFDILNPIYNPSYLKFPTYLTVPSQKTSICLINQLSFSCEKWSLLSNFWFYLMWIVECWIFWLTQRQTLQNWKLRPFQTKVWYIVRWIVQFRMFLHTNENK